MIDWNAVRNSRQTRSRSNVEALRSFFLCRSVQVSEVPKGFQRNAELKRHLQLWEGGVVHDLIGQIWVSNTRCNKTGRRKQQRLQTEVQREKRACALGLVGATVQQNVGSTRLQV